MFGQNVLFDNFDLMSLIKCLFFTGRNHILLSLCPQVFGMYFIKLAASMVLAGGVQRTDSSGTKIRGESVFTLSSMSLT